MVDENVGSEEVEDTKIENGDDGIVVRETTVPESSETVMKIEKEIEEGVPQEIIDKELKGEKLIEDEGKEENVDESKEKLKEYKEGN